MGPVPATGTSGVGAAVTTSSTSHVQSVCSVQLALRHIPSKHTNPEAQSVLMTQVLLQLASGGLVGVGVAVFAGVPVGVLVGVLAGVPVGVSMGVSVGVLMVRLNDNVQAGAAAFGVACGTVGATGFVVVNR